MKKRIRAGCFKNNMLYSTDIELWNCQFYVSSTVKSIVFLPPSNLLITVINFSVFDSKLEYQYNCYVIRNVGYVLVYDRLFYRGLESNTILLLPTVTRRTVSYVVTRPYSAFSSKRTTLNTIFKNLNTYYL